MANGAEGEKRSFLRRVVAEPVKETLSVASKVALVGGIFLAVVGKFNPAVALVEFAALAFAGEQLLKHSKSA